MLVPSALKFSILHLLLSQESQFLQLLVSELHAVAKANLAERVFSQYIFNQTIRLQTRFLMCSCVCINECYSEIGYYPLYVLD